MTEKVKALELADALVCHVQLGGGDLEDLEEAAMMLRRQHQNHIKAWDIIHQQGVELVALRKQKAELLEAAKMVLAWYEAEDDHSKADFYQRLEMCRDSETACRAAIAKAEGEHK
jgi:hypothetical protein